MPLQLLSGTNPVILSALPPAPVERRLAQAVMLVSLLVFAAMLPFAKEPLGKVSAFIPIYESALVINDLITAVLLIGQFMISRSRSMQVLLFGYFFTGLMAIVHMLSFPGLFADSGLLWGDKQTTAWLYMFWHGGFPLCVLAYTRLRGQVTGDSHRTVTYTLGLAALAVLALGALAGTGLVQLLPTIMEGNHYTPTMLGVVTVVWGLSLLALIALWRQHKNTVLDLWLAVVMCAWLCDIALSSVFNAARFDLGFYAGRIYGLVAASLVLLVLLVENGWLYRRLLEATIDLQRMMSSDALTGIANRRAFDEAFALEWRRSQRSHTPLSLLMVDVDHFKRFNDHHGHVQGDHCLRAVAQALAGVAQRAGDVAARYGGEEFVLLLPDTPLEEATQLAQRCCQTVEQLALSHGDSPTAAHVTISVGVACTHAIEVREAQAVRLLERADAALYVAKQAGRNRAQATLNKSPKSN